LKKLINYILLGFEECENAHKLFTSWFTFHERNYVSKVQVLKCKTISKCPLIKESKVKVLNNVSNLEIIPT